MALEATTTELDGFTITVTKLPATRSVKLLHKLVKVAGPAALKALANIKGVVKLADLDLSEIADGAQSLMDRLSADDLDYVIKEVLGTATLLEDDKEMLLLKVADAKVDAFTLLKATWFALGVNYGNFSGGFLARLAALAPEPSKGSTT